MDNETKEKAAALAGEAKKKATGIWTKIVALWKSGTKGKAICIVGVLVVLGIIGAFTDDEEGGGGGGGSWKYTGEYFDSVFEGFPKDEGVVYQHFPRPFDDFGVLGSFALSLTSAVTGSSDDSYLVPIKVRQATKMGNLVTTEDSDRLVWVETKRRYEDDEKLDEGYYIRRGSYEYTTALGAEKTVARYVEVTDKGILKKIQKQIEAEKAAAEAKAKAKAEAEAKAKAEAEAKAKAEITAMQAGKAAGETKTITLPGGVTMEMVWCPPGTFMMGSPSNEEGRDDDEPQHQVTLTKGFWMAKTEVTQKQWKSVMGNNPSDHEGDDLPVERVSWDDCVEFCEKTGLQLPTEAQWEHACRAGSTTALPNGPIRILGKNNAPALDEIAWYGGNSSVGWNGTDGVDTSGWADKQYPGGNAGPHPVGRKKPNAWGLYDMHGSVWEWCQDWYGNYPSGAVTDPQGPSSGSLRVLRGGGWDGIAANCRSANRGSSRPSSTSIFLGFRPARVLSE